MPAYRQLLRHKERATNKHTRSSEHEAEEGKGDLAGDEIEEAEELEDVEEGLDVILAARLSGGHRDDFEEVDDEDIRLEGAADVVPLRRSDEFLCRACFLLKRTSQLADRSAQLCRDCA